MDYALADPHVTKEALRNRHAFLVKTNKREEELPILVGGDAEDGKIFNEGAIDLLGNKMNVSPFGAEYEQVGWISTASGRLIIGDPLLVLGDPDINGFDSGDAEETTTETEDVASPSEENHYMEEIAPQGSGENFAVLIETLGEVNASAERYGSLLKNKLFVFATDLETSHLSFLPRSGPAGLISFSL